MENERNDVEVRFPDITVDMTGVDGNAYAVMGAVARAMRRGGCEQRDIDEFYAEATSGDYDNLLRTAMNTVNVL